MPGWTTDRIPDLDGRTAIVTGANSGLGRAVATALTAKGARVVLACRNLEKATPVVAACQQVARGGTPESRVLDLADLDSVRSFAASVDDLGGIDILVNNAGVMALPQMLTADGFEMQLGTNHLGHFALTGLLLPHLRPGARVVSVSSIMANFGSIRFDDLQGERGYHPSGAYSQSKLANLLFTAAFDRRLRDAHRQAVAVAAHPGYASTNMTSGKSVPGKRSRYDIVLGAGVTLLAHSAATGALPLLYAAAAPAVESGQYFGPRGPLQLWGRPRKIGYPVLARKAEAARRLWEVSEELTGVEYDFDEVARP
ncbi:MAG: oxidoreductase [Acidimicrobiales bacterium]